MPLRRRRANWCNQHEIALQLAHAKTLKAISYAKVKTDSVDAQTLADLLRAGLIPTAYKTDGSPCDLRELTKIRLRMIDHRRKLQGSLAAKYNVLVQDVGWRYLDRLEDFLIDGLLKVVHRETILLFAQIRQYRDHIKSLEHVIEQQVNFQKDVELLLVVTGFWGAHFLGTIMKLPIDRLQIFEDFCQSVERQGPHLLHTSWSQSCYQLIAVYQSNYLRLSGIAREGWDHRKLELKVS